MNFLSELTSTVVFTSPTTETKSGTKEEITTGNKIGTIITPLSDTELMPLIMNVITITFLLYPKNPSMELGTSLSSTNSKK